MSYRCVFYQSVQKQNNLNKFALLNAKSITTPYTYATNINRTNVHHIEVFLGGCSDSIILNSVKKYPIWRKSY